MKVVVLGGGVIGITTAYYLARQGAEVELIERQPAAALETSFANAGQVSPGYSTPWAAPGIPLKAMKWLMQRHAPLAIRPDGSLFQWRWMAHMLSQCNSKSYAINKGRMMRLAEYSRDCLRELRDEVGLHYDHGTGGTLQLLRTDAQMEAVHRDTEVLREMGVPFELLDRPALARVEPALGRTQQALAGGLRLPNDETGDCHLFTQALAAQAQALGVRMRYDTPVQRLLQERGRLAGVQLANGECVRGDRYIVAMGSYSRQMLLPLGIDLPVYPVKGYSLTIPLVDESLAPRSTVLDETYKVALTRLGNRIRVGGMAELGGYDLRLNPRRRATLEKVVGELFPGGDLSRAEFWTGLRPMTPDSTPLVGATRHANLFLNTGHGTLGWTMACGSGRLMADLVMGRRPEIDTEGFTLDRYGRASQRASARPSGHLPLGSGYSS